MITAWVLSLIGLATCFSGYRIFKDILALWGFLLGGALGFLAAGSLFPESGAVEKLAGFILGGVIGAGLAFPLYRLILFTSGAVMGLTLSNVISNLFFPAEPTARLLVGLALIFISGGIALVLQKATLICSTSIFGAALVLSGPLYATGLPSSGIWQSIRTVQQVSHPIPAVWYAAWLVIALVGIAIQAQYNRGKE